MAGKRPSVMRDPTVAVRRNIHRKLYRRMYWWRAGCAAAILLLLPFARIGFEVLLLQTEAMAQAVDCRSSKYGRLWYCTAGDDRNRWTEPLNEREQRIWQGVLALARERTFVFRDPVPVRTTAEADSFQRPLESRIYAEAFASGRIMFSTQDMNLMSDDEVALLMAHELGHQIDMQSERTGHPVLNRLAFADHETVAWGVAAELYGGEAVEQFRQKWQRRLLGSFD